MFYSQRVVWTQNQVESTDLWTAQHNTTHSSILTSCNIVLFCYNAIVRECVCGTCTDYPGSHLYVHCLCEENSDSVAVQRSWPPHILLNPALSTNTALRETKMQGGLRNDALIEGDNVIAIHKNTKVWYHHEDTEGPFIASIWKLATISIVTEIKYHNATMAMCTRNNVHDCTTVSFANCILSNLFCSFF